MGDVNSGMTGSFFSRSIEGMGSIYIIHHHKRRVLWRSTIYDREFHSFPILASTQ